jgi:hypothetical protein
MNEGFYVLMNHEGFLFVKYEIIIIILFLYEINGQN